MVHEVAPEDVSHQSGHEDIVRHTPQGRGDQMNSSIIGNAAKGTRNNPIACIRKMKNDRERFP